MNRNVITAFTKYTRQKHLSNEVLSCFFKDQIILANNHIGFHNANFFYCNYNDDFVFQSEWNNLNNYNKWINATELNDLYVKYNIQTKYHKTYNKYHLFDDVFLL
tara:strand:- start:582 stop:896 length:315 start_codon:yes stop_codon:yes gene_type:complete